MNNVHTQVKGGMNIIGVHSDWSGVVNNYKSARYLKYFKFKIIWLVCKSECPLFRGLSV